MAGNPIWKRLRPTGLNIGVIGCSERGDEDLRLTHFARIRANHVHGMPRIVDKQAFACRMALTHHRRQAALPPGVELTIAAVPIAVRMDGAILFPEQRQGHALAAQLAVHIRPIWLRNGAGRSAGLMRIKPMLKRDVGQVIGQWPGQPGNVRTPEILRHRRPPKRQALRYTTP